MAFSASLNDFVNKYNIKPFLVFENLNSPDIKKLAYRCLKSFAGIYMIVNLKNGNGKFYIGSAIKGNIYMRFHRHLFSLIGNIKVANSVRKYGLESFAFIILETMPEDVNGTNVPYLLSREDHYILSLKPQFNNAPLATNSSG
jgi:group I intron endonuclease